jgi:hypothetical protein
MGTSVRRTRITSNVPVVVPSSTSRGAGDLDCRVVVRLGHLVCDVLDVAEESRAVDDETRALQQARLGAPGRKAGPC